MIIVKTIFKIIGILTILCIVGLIVYANIVNSSVAVNRFEMDVARIVSGGILIIASLPPVLFPKQTTSFGYAWKFENTEPTELGETTTFLAGFAMLIIGIFIALSS